MIKQNFVKEKIKRGEPVIGTWNTMNSPLVTDILASAGLDFLFIDHEHGSFDFSQTLNFVNAAESYAKKFGFRNIQELAAASMREKIFREGVNENLLPALMSEEVLAKDWLTKEEDEAWKDL